MCGGQETIAMANLLLDEDNWVSIVSFSQVPPAVWERSFATEEEFGNVIFNQYIGGESGTSDGSVFVTPWPHPDAPAGGTLRLVTMPDVGGFPSGTARDSLTLGSGDNTFSLVTEPNDYLMIARYDSGGAYEGPWIAYGPLEAALTWEPEPIPEPNPIYVIRNTWRAYQGATTELSCWIRGENGKIDLTLYESLEVHVSRGQNRLLRLDATGDTEGQLTFQVTNRNIENRLSLLGSFRVTVIGDDEVIATGLLEVI